MRKYLLRRPVFSRHFRDSIWSLLACRVAQMTLYQLAAIVSQGTPPPLKTVADHCLLSTYFTGVRARVRLRVKAHVVSNNTLYRFDSCWFLEMIGTAMLQNVPLFYFTASNCPLCPIRNLHGSLLFSSKATWLCPRDAYPMPRSGPPTPLYYLYTSEAP